MSVVGIVVENFPSSQFHYKITKDNLFNRPTTGISNNLDLGGL